MTFNPVTFNDMMKRKDWMGLPDEAFEENYYEKLILKRLNQEILKHEAMIKAKKQKKKLKRYYLKPKGVGNWILVSEWNGERNFPWLFNANKKKLIKRSAEFIRKNGGGTLRIMLKNGRFQEERTYPKSADPQRSKG